MTLNNLTNQIPEKDRDEEAIMIYYTKSDAQELTQRDITDEQWTKIMDALEASDFYESIYERIKQIAEDVMESNEHSERIETTDKYWDCECEESYIHPAEQESCAKCGATREDSPDSIVDEVMMYGFKIL